MLYVNNGLISVYGEIEYIMPIPCYSQFSENVYGFIVCVRFILRFHNNRSFNTLINLQIWKTKTTTYA